MPKAIKVIFAATGSLVVIFVLFCLLIDRREFSSSLQALTVQGAQAMMSERTNVAERSVLKELDQAVEEKHHDVSQLVIDLRELGECYELTGRFDEAAMLYTRLASIEAVQYGEDSHQYLETRESLERISSHSSLLQKCPQFSKSKGIDWNKYSKI